MANVTLLMDTEVTDTIQFSELTTVYCMDKNTRRAIKPLLAGFHNDGS